MCPRITSGGRREIPGTRGRIAAPRHDSRVAWISLFRWVWLARNTARKSWFRPTEKAPSSRSSRLRGAKTPAGMASHKFRRRRTTHGSADDHVVCWCFAAHVLGSCVRLGLRDPAAFFRRIPSVASPEGCPQPLRGVSPPDCAKRVIGRSCFGTRTGTGCWMQNVRTADARRPDLSPRPIPNQNR